MTLRKMITWCNSIVSGMRFRILNNTGHTFGDYVVLKWVRHYQTLLTIDRQYLVVRRHHWIVQAQRLHHSQNREDRKW